MKEVNKKKLDKIFLSLKKKSNFSIGFVLLSLLLMGVITSLFSYNIGHNDGYESKEIELKSVQDQNNINNLMTWEFNELLNHTGKLVLSWLIVHSFWLKAFVFLVLLSVLLKVIT